MCEILDTLHKYCPTSTSTEEGTLPNGDPHVVKRDNIYQILFGGDQLTCV